jgi:HEAT repeat protein
MAQIQEVSAQSAAAVVCGAFHRAYREWRLYPPGHPTAQESLENLAEQLAGYMEQWGTLALGVREDALILEGEPVYERESTSRDNLAFLMFRDGLRAIFFHPGCETRELEGLVDCLAHAYDLPNMEHDLVTALWERELVNIEYEVVDPFLGGSGLREGTVNALRETVAGRVEIVRSDILLPGDPATINVRDVKAKRYGDEVLALTPDEEQQRNNAATTLLSPIRDYAEVLLEIAGKIPVANLEDMVIESLAAVVGAFLDDEDLLGVMLVLEHLGMLEEQRYCPVGSVAFVSGDAVTADRLRRLLDGAREGSSDRYEEIQRFLMFVRRWITPSLLEILTEAGDRVVRKTILEILGDKDVVRWQDLEPLLIDPRWYVVRNAVHLAADIGHYDLVYHAGRLLAHPDVRVRRETVRALGRLGSSDAVRGLAHALSDGDPSVRTLAAHAVGRRGGPEQKAALLARIEDRGFSYSSPEELEAFLGAYAEVAQGLAVPMLDRAWRKGRLSTRPTAFRLAALAALGRVRGSGAQEALEEAARSDDPQMRRAAAETLQKRASTMGMMANE